MTKRWLTGICVLAAVTGGCASRAPQDPELVGEAEATLASVPATVACIAITGTSGGRTVQKKFTVSAGQSSVLSLTGMPIGSVTFVGDAFDTACSAVDSTTRASWVSDAAVTVTLTPATSPKFTLLLRQNGTGTATVDFDDDAGAPDAQPACVPGATCSTGLLGACAQGVIRCDSGAPQCVAQTTPSTAFHTTAAPNGSWDWNCDGQVTEQYAGTYWPFNSANGCQVSSTYTSICGFYSPGACGTPTKFSTWSSYACSANATHCGEQIVRFRCGFDAPTNACTYVPDAASSESAPTGHYMYQVAGCY